MFDGTGTYLHHLACGSLDQIHNPFVSKLRNRERHLRIYAGNLDRDVTEEVLRELFATHGQVESVSIMRDRDTQRSKGFAFIGMPSRTEGQAAIQALNESEFHQRVLTVNEARPREERSPTNAGVSRPSAADERRRSVPRGGRDRR